MLENLSLGAEDGDSIEAHDDERECADADIEEDYGTELEDLGDDNITRQRRSRQRQAYQPPKDSTIGDELHNFKGT